MAREIRCLANRGHGQVAEYCHLKLGKRWWTERNWPKLAGLDPWLLELLGKLREVILVLAAQGLKARLAEGSAVRKKTVVALARLLAIDLWRWPRESVGHKRAVAIRQVLSRGWRTSRATLADLGWVPA